MLVVRRSPSCSGSATMAMTYGGSKFGNQGCQLTVNVWTVARPDAASGASERPRQLGQMGCGGWIQ